MEWGRIAIGVGIVVFALWWLWEFRRDGGTNASRWRTHVAAAGAMLAVGGGIWVAWITNAGSTSLWLWLLVIGALGATGFALWIDRGKPWT